MLLYIIWLWLSIGKAIFKNYFLNFSRNKFIVLCESIEGGECGVPMWSMEAVCVWSADVGTRRRGVRVEC